MTDQPEIPHIPTVGGAPTDSQPDLFDLAAELAGCAPVELLKVRQDGARLVVILITGQKFVFDGADIAGRIADVVRAQLRARPTAGQSPTGDAAPDPAPAAVQKTKAKK